jgi:hypothetical protein
MNNSYDRDFEECSTPFSLCSWLAVQPVEAPSLSADTSCRRAAGEAGSSATQAPRPSR